MKLTNKIVVFDLDGTLIDTLPDIAYALNKTAQKFNINNINKNELKRLLSYGSMTLIKKQFELSYNDYSEKDLIPALDFFIKYYSKNLSTYSQLFPGILDCLIWLKKHGIKMSVCTNKYEKLAKKIIENLGINNFFSSVTGSDTFKYRKPNPFHLEETVRISGCKIQNTVMVGDSLTDYKTARNAKVPIIIVSWGYSDIPPEDIDGDEFAKDGEQLLDSIKRILKINEE